MRNIDACLYVRPSDRTTLERLVADGKTPQKIVARARIVLLSGRGLGTNSIQREARVSKPTVWRWQKAYMDGGVERLLKDRGKGARAGKKSISAEVRLAIVKRTAQEKPKHATHWSARMLAEEIGVGHTTVQRVWKEHGLKPHLTRPFKLYPELRENPKTPLAKRRDPDSTERMIRPGFLDIESRQNLIELARDGLAAHRLARRANALVLLDDGMSCEAIAKVLLLDDDTIRTWYRLYEEDGIEGLTNFSYEGSACQLSGEQQEKLKAWVATALPRTTRQVGAWIENEFGVVYEGRSGLIALLHRLGLEYHKPNVIPRKLDEEKQKAFIEGYEKLLNSLGDDEAVLFADAVHPTHAARPVGCWAPSQEKLAIEQTSGRQRINIHGAIDLETGQTRMIEALTIDAASTIRLLQSIEALYPMLVLIHVFLDNARYHHAKLVQEWLALPGRRIKLHFIPTYCPHLNPIERLWGLMHRNVTHNKCYATCAQFADATLSFLREKVPGNWADLCDSVTDNFRVINPKDFRVMT